MRSLNIQYITKIDHLRFIAALMVMIFHFSKSKFTAPLALGVELFFVLSAFVFTIITDGGNKNIIYSKFIYNRFLRIFPLVIVLFFTVISVMRANFRGSDIFNILFLNMPMGAGGKQMFEYGAMFISFPWWTVGIEFYFYLIFPFIILFYKKYGIKYLFLIIIIKILLYFGVCSLRESEDGFANTYRNLHYSIIGHLDSFVIGIMAGIFYTKKEKFTKLYKIFSSSIFLILMVIILYLWELYKDTLIDINLAFETTIQSTLLALIIISYLCNKIKIPTFINNLFAKIGMMSFSTYLLHEFIRDVMLNINIINSSQNMCFYEIFFCIFIIYSISCITYYTIEKPFLEMRKKYIE